MNPISLIDWRHEFARALYQQGIGPSTAAVTAYAYTQGMITAPAEDPEVTATREAAILHQIIAEAGQGAV